MFSIELLYVYYFSLQYIIKQKNIYFDYNGYQNLVVTDYIYYQT